MSRPPLEVADILRREGASWRRAHAGHINLSQLQVMSAIERCRTSELGGHVLYCGQCEEQSIAYNSCRNRHCPKCCGTKAQQWLEDRKKDLLPIEYFHVVFTLPAQISDLAYQNKAVLYALLFKVSAETLATIAADPKHLGAKIGFTSVLHTWGSALTHHPHVHCVVPGGGLDTSLDWKACKPGFFLPVRVLSRLFRRLFLEQLHQAYLDGTLTFHGKLTDLQQSDRFREYLAPLKSREWVVYAKRPFAGPEAVLAYLSRYTHRVAIANHRLIRHDEQGVTFKWKDYRTKRCVRYKPMTLTTDEFIRRFLIHVLPKGFHRIRHYGLLASPVRRKNRLHLCAALAVKEPDPIEVECEKPAAFTCRTCGEPLRLIDSITPRNRAPPCQHH